MKPAVSLRSFGRLPSVFGVPFRLRDSGSSVTLAFLLGLASGCGRIEPPADLVIVNGKEPESLDPAVFTGQPDGRIGLSLFEGLTRYDPVTAAATPGLAERWNITPDGRTYTFHLRSDAQWSTGEPITAHDFVYAWQRVLDPATACDYVGLLFYLKNAEAFCAGRIRDADQVGLRALDDRTLQVELVNPTPFFLEVCAYPTLAVVPRKTIEKHGDRWLTARPLPVSGAFELVSWRLNDRIRLQKNRRYWDAANTQSDIVDLLPVSVAATALNLYETGAADIIWDKDLVPVELLDILRRRQDFHTFDYLATYFFRFNVTRKPFDDVRVRQALALVLDKQRIVERITRGGEKAADHYVPPGLSNYRSPSGLGYEPQRARRLLAEAGFPGGKGFPRFHYLFNTGRAHETIAVEMRAMWQQELGVEVELRSLEWKVYLRANPNSTTICAAAVGSETTTMRTPFLICLRATTQTAARAGRTNAMTGCCGRPTPVLSHGSASGCCSRRRRSSSGMNCRSSRSTFTSASTSGVQTGSPASTTTCATNIPSVLSARSSLPN